MTYAAGIFYVKAVLMYPRYRAGFLKNDLCGGGACSADQIRRGAAHLRTDAPAGNVDLLLGQHTFVKDGAVLLFHAHRAAAAPHIAGDLVDIRHMDHCHALFAHAAGCGFQVQLCRHRNDGTLPLSES